MKYSERDISFFKNDNFMGDIQIEDNDFKLVENEKSIKQEVMNRLKTNNPDWVFHPNNGADLEDLRGMEQSRETAEKGKQNIMECLTHDGKFSSVDIRIEPVPTARNEITYFIFMNVGKKEPLVIEYQIEI